MSLFRKELPAPAPPLETGIDVLRRTLKARDHKAGSLLAICRDISGLGIADLENFAAGKIMLKRELLQGIAKELYGAKLDDNDMLTPLIVNVPKPLCTAMPPKFDAKSSPYHFPYDPAAPMRFPQPVKPVPPLAKIPRAGWA